MPQGAVRRVIYLCVVELPCSAHNCCLPLLSATAVCYCYCYSCLLLPRLQAAVAGSEPSDAIRAVNALLTQLDALRRFPNVMVLTTSNITQVGGWVGQCTGNVDWGLGGYLGGWCVVVTVLAVVVVEVVAGLAS